MIYTVQQSQEGMDRGGKILYIYNATHFGSGLQSLFKQNITSIACHAIVHDHA